MRIVVNFDAFDRWIAGKKSGNIEHQTQQFGRRKKKECVCGGQNSGNGDAVPQKLYVEWRRENHPLVFATRNGEVGGVLFVVGVAGSGKVESDGKKRKICKIMVDVAGRG